METNHLESAVKERYGKAAHEQEASLCCPVSYNQEYLKVIPQEVIERDYGCGDPSQYVNPGETVLDLGSGTGKICFIASQVVGPEGKVIGVDMTDEMLGIARRNAPVIAEKIGYANVEFRKGRIQDLSLNIELLDQELKKKPITDANAFLRADETTDELRLKKPLVESDSVDVVVSNCVLNLVDSHHKRQMFDEIFRVLKKGGRAVISDIVSDETVPRNMQDDPELWSGCISGALTEEEFLQAFVDAGFYGVQVLKFDKDPWQTVNGIEFRSLTLEAYKGKQGPCYERNQAVIYKGPFAEVLDDDGHRLKRGVRYAVCDKTFNLYKKSPYASSFEFIEPLQNIKLEDAKIFDCSGPSARRRDPRETKGRDYNATKENSQYCNGGNGASNSCC
ncbi:MAG: methyltransferase domain-containing protein [Verrucomicrobiota bacterium]